MTFAPGQLDTNDISPNAGIQGNQLADGTLQARNFAPNVIPAAALPINQVFKIVKSGTITTTASLVANTTTVISTPHGLGFTPAYIMYQGLNTGTFYPDSGIPVGFMVASGGGIQFTRYIFTSIDAINININIFSGGTATDVTRTFTYYLLQQTAG